MCACPRCAGTGTTLAMSGYTVPGVYTDPRLQPRNEAASTVSTGYGAMPIAISGIKMFDGLPHGLKPSRFRQLGDYTHPSIWNGFKATGQVIPLMVQTRVAIGSRSVMALAPTRAYASPNVRLTINVVDQHMAVPAPEGLPLPVGTSSGNTWQVEMGRFGFAFEVQKPYATYSPDAASEIAAGIGQIEEAFNNRGEALVYSYVNGIPELPTYRLKAALQTRATSELNVQQLLADRAMMHNVLARNPRAILTMFDEAEAVKDTLMGTEPSIMMVPSGGLNFLRTVFNDLSPEAIGEEAFRDTFGVNGVSNLTVGSGRPIIESRPLPFLQNYHRSLEPLSEPFEFACHYSFHSGGEDKAVQRVWIRDMENDSRKCFTVAGEGPETLQSNAFDASASYRHANPDVPLPTRGGGHTYLILRLRVLRQVASVVVGKGGGAWAHLGYCFPSCDVADSGEEERVKFSQRGHLGVIETNPQAMRRIPGAAYVRDGLISGGGVTLWNLHGAQQGALNSGRHYRAATGTRPDLAVIRLDGQVDIPAWLYPGKRWGTDGKEQALPADLLHAFDHLFHGMQILNVHSIVCPSSYDNREAGHRLASSRGPMVIEYANSNRVHIPGEGYECRVLYPNTNAAEERRYGSSVAMLHPSFPPENFIRF